ncbi:sugar kinase [Salinibacterium soli]|uniref:Sugar kinase n=1 Tax=Antiquaquibacter soli TaxID=3064523 RepID=A0ABT9BQF2_9MICO|nr:sugar kinase [Protaetiibacter sp. WY-16]MDO7883263.1 sugar kinase [Protaetiibacter sp. WY-16]
MSARVVTLGETMALVRAAHVGSLATESELRLGVGGAESNVAIALTRLGTPTTWVGRVGSDPLGERILRELRAEGVDARAVVDPAAPTGLMVKESRTPASTRVMYYRAGSAGSRLSPVDLAAAGIREAGLLHVSGITPALSDSAAAAVDAAVDEAVAAGIPVSFDVNHRSSLWRDRDFGAVYRGLAARADIVFAGEDEARLLAEGSTPASLARAIAALGPSQVVIKLGADGCLALVDGVEHAQPAVRIEPVDTVGAGDAFVAGYLAELLAGLPVADRLATAVRTGAFACLSPGDWEGYPRRAELALLDGGEPVAR